MMDAFEELLKWLREQIVKISKTRFPKPRYPMEILVAFRAVTEGIEDEG